MQASRSKRPASSRTKTQWFGGHSVPGERCLVGVDGGKLLSGTLISLPRPEGLAPLLTDRWMSRRRSGVVFPMLDSCPRHGICLSEQTWRVSCCPACVVVAGSAHYLHEPSILRASLIMRLAPLA